MRTFLFVRSTCISGVPFICRCRYLSGCCFSTPWYLAVAARLERFKMMPDACLCIRLHLILASKPKLDNNWRNQSRVAWSSTFKITHNSQRSGSSVSDPISPLIATFIDFLLFEMTICQVNMCSVQEIRAKGAVCILCTRVELEKRRILRY